MESKPLIPDVIVGRDISDCVVLASHPDERRDGRKPALDRRTIAMRFDGRRFFDATSLPYAIARGWASSSGASYCTPIRGKDVHIHADGQWRREQFCDEDVNVLRIGGVPGSDPASDLLCISSQGTLFVYRKGQWARFVTPGAEQRFYGVHGRSTDELYVCCDAGLLLWRDGALHELEDRPRPLVKSVLVVGSEIYAGDDYLLHWRKETGWQRWEPTVSDVTALLDVNDVIFVGTFERGVLERQGSSFEAATPPFMCLKLQQVGSGVFAAGDHGGYVRIGGRWSKLVMPACPAGQLPLDVS